MAAYDNVSLPGAPNIATAGQFGTQLFQMLQSLGQDYQKGQDFQYQQQQRNLFQSPDNQAVLQDAIKTGNYSPLLQKLIQSGGASAAAGLVPSLMSIQGGKEVGDAITGGGSTANLAPTGQTPAMLNRQPGGGQSDPRIPTTNPASLSAGGDGSAPETVRSLTAGIANGRPVSDASIANFAKALGVHPDADLTPDQEARAQTIIGNNLRSSGSQSPPPATNDAASGGSPINSAAAGQGNESPVVGSGGGPPISPAQTTAQGGGSLADRFPQYGTGGARPVKTVQATQPGLRESPVGTEAEARQLQAKATQLRAIAARIGGINKGAAEQAKDAADKADDRAKQIFESIGKYNEPGTQPQVKGQLEASGAAGKAKGERVGEAIKAGGAGARDTISTLDVMEEAVHRSGGNFTTGPGAAESLKFKQAVNNIIPGFFSPQSIVDAEAISKLNAKLAADAAKAMTARPSQLEFKAFMANNPGLANSPQGSLFLIDILRQTQQQKIGLGKEALRLDDINKWGDVEDQYYKDNPIKSPFSGKPLNGKERVDGGVAGGPPVGHIEQGYRFRGGNPKDPKSWEPVAAGDRS